MPRECLSDVALGQRQEGFKAEKPPHSLQGFKGFKGFEGF